MIWKCCYVCLLYIFHISMYFSFGFVTHDFICFMFYFFSHDQVVTLQVFKYCFWRMSEHLLSCILLSIVIWNYFKSQWLKTRCIYFLTASVGQWQLNFSVSGFTPGCSHRETRPRKFPISLKWWLTNLRSVPAFWLDSALCHPCLCITLYSPQSWKDNHTSSWIAEGRVIVSGFTDCPSQHDSNKNNKCILFKEWHELTLHMWMNFKHQPLIPESAGQQQE